MALSDQRRQQLDGIVQKMTSNKESSQNIQLVVNDFKKKYSSESSTTPQQAEPSDSSVFVNNAKKTASVFGTLARSLVKPLAQTAIQLPRTVIGSAAQLPGDIKSYVTQKPIEQTGARKLGERMMKPVNVPLLGEVKPLSSLPSEASSLQQLGQAAEIGSLAVGARTIPAALKTAKAGKIGAAAVEGALTGAETGALTGFGQKAQEEGATALEAAKSSLKGAALGAAVGGAAGAASSALSRAAALTRKEAKIVDLVSPQLTKTEKAAAIASGRAKESGVFKTAKLSPDKKTLETARAVSDFVDPKKSLPANVNAVRSANMKEAQSLKEIVSGSKAIISPNELKKRLRSIERPPMLIADSKQASLYQQAEDKFLKFVQEEPGTPSGLLEARKKFDSWIEDNIPKIWDEPTMRPLHRALRDMRTAANDHLAEKLPDIAFKDSLRKQNLMYEAIDNMSDKAVAELNIGPIQRVTKKYPRTAKAAKFAGAAGLGAAGVKTADVILGD